MARVEIGKIIHCLWHMTGFVKVTILLSSTGLRFAIWVLKKKRGSGVVCAYEKVGCWGSNKHNMKAQP